MPLRLLPTAVALAAVTASATGQDALQSLVDAERGFAKMSVEQGMKAAFLGNLADDGIVFQPLPINGKKVWEARTQSASTLVWEPSYAEVSAAGDLGFTTGPWELRPPADSNRPTVNGHFHSVWRRRPGGAWKVAVDIGGSHQRTEPGVGSGAFEAGPAPVAQGKGDRTRAAVQEILSAEKKLARDTQHGGFAAAFATAAADDVRLGRDGEIPAAGIDAATRALSSDIFPARWTPQGSGAASSGDLGYAYGVRERVKAPGVAPDSSVFLDVWRREAGHWKLVLVVDNPVRR